MKVQWLKMKKRIRIFAMWLICVVGVISFAGTNVHAETTADGNYEYEVLEDGTVEITDYYGAEIKLVIPDIIDGKDVNKAFKNSKKLKSVTMGKNVQKIGKEAFSGCKNVKKVTIKSEVLKSVGKNAIKGIHKKATIKVPGKQLKQYKKLFKSKTGYKKTMKFKK